MTIKQAYIAGFIAKFAQQTDANGASAAPAESPTYGRQSIYASPQAGSNAERRSTISDPLKLPLNLATMAAPAKPPAFNPAKPLSTPLTQAPGISSMMAERGAGNFSPGKNP